MGWDGMWDGCGIVDVMGNGMTATSVTDPFPDAAGGEADAVLPQVLDRAVDVVDPEPDMVERRHVYLSEEGGGAYTDTQTHRHTDTQTQAHRERGTQTHRGGDIERERRKWVWRKQGLPQQTTDRRNCPQRARP